MFVSKRKLFSPFLALAGLSTGEQDPTTSTTTPTSVSEKGKSVAFPLGREQGGCPLEKPVL